jgi:hypothetical protein
MARSWELRRGGFALADRKVKIEPVPHKGTVTRRFLAYSSPSRSPDPHHLAVLARPGFVRAAPTLPGTTRIRLPSSTALLRQEQRRRSHLHSNHSASRRTHDLRHTENTLAETGATLRELMERMGHRSTPAAHTYTPETTAIERSRTAWTRSSERPASVANRP